MMMAYIPSYIIIKNPGDYTSPGITLLLMTPCLMHELMHTILYTKGSGLDQLIVTFMRLKASILSNHGLDHKTPER
jgi:hypothetical protein